MIRVGRERGGCGGTLLKQEEELGARRPGQQRGDDGWARGGECQSHKSNLRLTPSSYKVYLHFHIAPTSKTSMFRLFQKQRDAGRISRARTSHPDPSKSRLTSCRLNNPLKALLLIARLYREFLFSTV